MQIKLDNITIKQLEDKNLNAYYLIINNNNQDEVYFCFEKAVRNGWENLKNNWDNIKEIEIEYEEQERGKKVIEIIGVSLQN